jgi:hypothetical protein
MRKGGSPLDEGRLLFLLGLVYSPSVFLLCPSSVSYSLDPCPGPVVMPLATNVWESLQLVHQASTTPIASKYKSSSIIVHGHDLEVSTQLGLQYSKQ